MRLLVIPSRPETVKNLFNKLNEKVLTREAFSVDVKGLATRSLNQNNLFHVWCTEFACWYLNCSKKELPKGYPTRVKNSFKQECYMDTGWDFLVFTEQNIFRGTEKTKLQSSSLYKPSEMHIFLDWVQAYAMSKHGCLLKAKGEYEMLKQRAVDIDV